ncbi:MAG TPA: hypothetical protein VFI97_08090 [Arthrobacter sp.]|nr:hypothetical protein [Arthrobacter sp.]
MREQTHPKRVVVVDAQNPLQEIHGEFFWREDHDRIVTAERNAGFERGYAEGFAAAQRQVTPQVVFRRRQLGLGRFALLCLALLVAISFVIALVGNLLQV